MRRRGGRARGRRSDDFNVDYEFDLFVEDVDGNVRIPNFVSLQTNPGSLEGYMDRYVFNETIENFTGSFENFLGDFSFTFIEINNPLSLDLTARYLPEETVITLPNGITPVEPVPVDPGLSDDDGNPDNSTDAARLEYIITGDELEDLGITELALIIEDVDVDTDGWQVVKIDENGNRQFDENGEAITQTVDIPVPINDGINDVNDKAINDLEFIVEEDLLRYVNILRTSGISGTDANQILSTENTASSELLDATLLDLRDSVDPVNVDFTVSRDAGFNSTVGFYEVNADGSVIVDPLTGDTVAPDEAGYLEAALANSLDVSLNAEVNNTTAEFSETLPGSNIYAPFIVVDGTIADVTDGDTSGDPPVYFSFGAANSDGVEHIANLGANTLGFEDLPGGGDLDFNDIVVEYEFV